MNVEIINFAVVRATRFLEADIRRKIEWDRRYDRLQILDGRDQDFHYPALPCDCEGEK
jgi:hypothetical protein